MLHAVTDTFSVFFSSKFCYGLSESFRCSLFMLSINIVIKIIITDCCLLLSSVCQFMFVLMQARDWCDQGMHLLEDDNVSEAFHSRLSDFSASRSSLHDLEKFKSSLDGIFTPLLEVVITAFALH